MRLRVRWPQRKTLGLLMGMGALWICGLLATIHIYGFTDASQNADAIIVLGAGLQRNDRPGPALTRRSNQAAELWLQGAAPVVICTGGITGTARRSEASACKELLLAQGVPENAIILEENSRSTEENAIYVFDIFSQNGWERGVLVSDSFHMLRAHWLFRQYGIVVYNSPVSASRIGFLDYVVAIGREVAALHWQMVKQLFNLPHTYVGGL